MKRHLPFATYHAQRVKQEANIVPRPLVLPFNRHGHTYSLVEREGNVALVRVADSVTDVTFGFEVVRIRIAQEQKMPGGKIAPVRETYPGDNDFGRDGFYFMKGDSFARDSRFIELCKKVNTSNS